ncbi:hypothetical protein EVJ58_g3990 [Rhodofomes roseus]|uniref:Uncharacterized protein n=1 Tax=Rhodofomes roseus TaxID=34475 RepID=A0A4Y9YKJ4_9APHY|nr:hypothetical protein EVJ58_g3990 [Rhodofomes roseus]
MSSDPDTERQRQRHQHAINSLTPPLTFNPGSVEHLAETLDRALQPTDAYQPQLAAADIAFFVAGAHKDGRHNLGLSNIHPMFNEAREDTGVGADGRRVRTQFRDGVQNLAFDTLTVLDRIDAGCTVAIHVSGLQQPGTRPTGTLPLPQDLRLHVYAPPHILTDLPTTKPALARIVQLFAEEIGVQTVQRFELLAREKLHWSFTMHSDQLTQGSQPSARGPPPLIPDARGTAHYIFRGRPRGELQQLLVDDGPAPQPTMDVDPQKLTEEIEILHRDIESYEEMMHGLDLDIGAKASTIVTLLADLADANSRIVAQEATIDDQANKIEEQAARIDSQAVEIHAARIERESLRKTNGKLKTELASAKETIRALKQRLSVDRGVQAPTPGASTLALPVFSAQGAVITAASELAPRYARGFGHAVQRVIERHSLEYLIHNVCEKVASSSAALVWQQRLNIELQRFNIPVERREAISAELSEAMQQDLRNIRC